MKIPASTRDRRILSSKIGQTMARVQWTAVNEADPNRFHHLNEAWKRLNKAWHEIGKALGYYYCR